MACAQKRAKFGLADRLIGPGVGRTLTLGGGAESSLEGRDIELSVSPKDIRTSPYDLCANRSDRRQSREGDRWFESTSLQRRVRLSPGAAVECREPRLSARLCGVAWRPGRQRRAGYFKIAPIGGNISVAPYSSTAEPLMGVSENATPVPIKSGRSPSLIVRWISAFGLNQSPARSADRARQAAGGSARGASLASDRAAAAHRGSPG